MAWAARVLAALAIFTFGADAQAAKWKQLARGAAGELWIDLASVKRNNGEAAFDYRVDYPRPQQEVGTGSRYRSTVTRAIVRCTTRSIAVGMTVAYDGAHGTGKAIGRYPPSPEEARFQPVEPGSSDENLWRHVCHIAEVTPRK